MNQDDVYNFDADFQTGRLINPRAVSNANSAVVKPEQKMTAIKRGQYQEDQKMKGQSDEEVSRVSTRKRTLKRKIDSQDSEEFEIGFKEASKQKKPTQSAKKTLKVKSFNNIKEEDESEEESDIYELGAV